MTTANINSKYIFGNVTGLGYNNVITRNSAVADKPQDTFVQMKRRGGPNQH